MDRLYGDYDYTFVDATRIQGMDFVQKYLRMKQVIVFKLSHDVIQFNFYDHSKVVLSEHGLMVTHIDKTYKLRKFTLAEIMTSSLRPPVADAEEAKMNHRLLEKTKYCRDVLVTIVNAAQAQTSPVPSAAATADGGESEPESERNQERKTGPKTALSATSLHTLASRASKMSIR